MRISQKYVYIASFIFLIVTIFFLLQYLVKSTLLYTPDYKVPNVRIQKSKIGGRGVFANQNYSVGEIIEVCPAIRLNDKDSVGNIADYVFGFNSEDNLVGFGYCSMYNHQDEPNANWEVINEEKIQIKVVKPIQKGEEIFVTYGEAYFSNRENIVKNTVE